MKKQNFLLYDYFFLLTIFLIALIFRLYKINAPLADLHSWRQADTAAVARNYVRDGIDLFHPHYDDLSGREAGIENPQGNRMVEFPLYNSIFASTYTLLPYFSLDIHGRLTSVFFSLIIIGIIYYLLLKESGRLSAIMGSFVYAVFPFFVFFSRVILPETTATGLTFISILFLYLYLTKDLTRLKEIIYLVLSSIFFALGLLVKPTIIFYSIVLIYLFFKKYGLNSLRKIDQYLFFILGFIPLIAWRLYIKNFPEGIPASDWLLTSVNTFEGLKTIFLRPAFFRWIFFERLNHMIFGGYMSVFFLLGVLRKSSKYFFHSFLIGILLYLFIFEGGNVQHEYYQTIILPTIAIFIGLGVDFLWGQRKNLHSPFLTIAAIFIIFVASFFFSYFTIKGFYSVPNDLVVIAKIIKTITNPDDKIVTDRLGDTTLLYLADRRGWPAYSGNLDYLKEKGYKYFVTANKNLISEFKVKKIYKAVFENDQFTIFAL
ncbi:hypothetical protein A2954_03805 [Candidatus Roizmanbacteria bacterium RIFCSPLOWO2_01_FULL_37_12]|uniref:Glycosyltransferase RgtA/B/C/D-like domain-containing protein n=1 Tax=Candidatus Roizmanbacteria bacterium RIFCSPLOWO2_01_FULL_37_12 TaxID=1802056 RepID=A0A1F7IEN4_9BACT|nr:MAG: hypothetical protein A3D76_02795 [Candidatus Roizmanbacteria bacterium RIFCSPHIGHO2_02_FULL_37_9b]OGK41811.1 MAG: hypothetical protein A2954_03805 [Candidatus Roizmanbacteria bacterium RIFCSPLOWO2_01_FULL_37_12]